MISHPLVTSRDLASPPPIRLSRALLVPVPGVSAWFLLGGWCGLAQRRFPRASLGVLRPARTLGVVGHCQMALEADPESSSIAELTAIGFHLIAHRCIQRRILGNLQVKATSHGKGIGPSIFTLSGEGTSTWRINKIDSNNHNFLLARVYKSTFRFCWVRNCTIFLPKICVCNWTLVS